MKKRQIINLNRKWHRYLGLLLGIQFLLWTLGGLYFSWTNIEDIRGDNLKTRKAQYFDYTNLISPSEFTSHLSKTDSIVTLELVSILDKPVYRLVTKNERGEQIQLFNANNGQELNPFNKDQIIGIATSKLKVNAPIKKIEHITHTGKHHEYRNRPLPAYAITFDKPVNTTIYVSEKFGRVETFRSTQWRIFDFLWMLHTMDYQERDNFNNLALRIFSLFGLITILSGFSLYIFTSRIFKQKKRK